MSIKVSVRRRASWGVILQVFIGGVFGVFGALGDNPELLILGIWLILQGQIHHMHDDLLERLP